MHKTHSLLLGAASLFCLGLTLDVRAQEKKRPLSPPGDAATQVGGKWVKKGENMSYEGGKWIDITYARPIKRTRDVFGAGAEYGKVVTAGAPLWRAGANKTTQLKTEVALELGGKKLAPGTYNLLVELKENAWTLVVSTQAVQEKYDPKNTTALWGAYNYDPKFDVARVPMKVSKHPLAVDQLTIGFADVTDKGGKLIMSWDTTSTAAEFTVSGG